VRLDGRARMDYRFFNIVTGNKLVAAIRLAAARSCGFASISGVIPHANGSARLKLDSTEVLVGVNLEIGQPDADAPESGRVVCSVEWYDSFHRLSGSHLTLDSFAAQQARRQTLKVEALRILTFSSPGATR
jgi:hypothetical protein